MTRIVVHVGRLVLNGFGADAREAVSEGLRAELGRLLAEPAVTPRLSALGHRERLPREQTHLSADAPARAAGTGVARAIVRGVSR